MGPVVVKMLSVRDILLYSSILLTIISHCEYGYGSCGGYGGGRGRKRVVSRVVVPREKRVHATHEVHHVVHNRRRRVRPVVVDDGYDIIEQPGFQGSVHIVEDNQPDVVVIDHGGQAYLQPTPVVVNRPPVQAVAVQGQPTQLVPVAVQPNQVVNPYNTGAIDPRLVPVLRGSTAQQGDPLGIYPGGGLDPRIDPSLVPAARGHLADEVRILQDQLDILTKRLGGRGRTSQRDDQLEDL